MAQFTVRNLEDDIHQQLREMARSQGQSLEDFVREVLRTVALERRSAPSNLGSKIANRFANVGMNEPIEELRGRPMTPPSLE